jgi:hypothetical protein
MNIGPSPMRVPVWGERELHGGSGEFLVRRPGEEWRYLHQIPTLALRIQPSGTLEVPVGQSATFEFGGEMDWSGQSRDEFRLVLMDENWCPIVSESFRLPAP